MTGVLEGMKVIDMGHVVAVPCTGAMLADWGADVIKVEPLTGDMLRGLSKTSRVGGVLKFDNGEVHLRIQLFNRNKRGLAVDLRKKAGRDILYQLTKEADVFMSNYEVSALKKLEMDYPTLSRVNPQLVYAVITGYGTVGPDKDERGFDFAAAWGRSGIQHLLGEPGDAPPRQRGGMMDRTAATALVAGILAALLHKEKTGKGQELECSLYHTGVWTLAPDIMHALVGQPLPKDYRTNAANPLANTYRTSDERWFQLAMLQSDMQWPGFCQAIGRPELENDLRFNSMQTREDNCQELIRILDEIFAAGTLEEWESLFRKNNCIYGAIRTPAEVTTDPQALANGFFASVNHPAAGQLKLVTTPVKFHQNPAELKTPAPELGQHTEEILLDLGYNWDDITRLKDDGVIL